MKKFWWEIEDPVIRKNKSDARKRFLDRQKKLVSKINPYQDQCDESENRQKEEEICKYF